MAIVLDSTLKSLEVKLGAAKTTTDCDFVAEAVDLLDSTQAVSDVAGADGLTNGTAAVTVISAPAAGHTKVVKEVSVYNADTVAQDVFLQLNDNGTKRVITKQNLAPGGSMLYQG